MYQCYYGSFAYICTFTGFVSLCPIAVYFKNENIAAMKVCFIQVNNSRKTGFNKQESSLPVRVSFFSSSVVCIGSFLSCWLLCCFMLVIHNTGLQKLLTHRFIGPTDELVLLKHSGRAEGTLSPLLVRTTRPFSSTQIGTLLCSYLQRRKLGMVKIQTANWEVAKQARNLLLQGESIYSRSCSGS